MPEAGRVIAGLAGGIRLEGAPSGTRPLSDRVKQALFASLEAEVALSDGFLDLFAGTGAAGIEALSRGANKATFVERDAKACTIIATNLERTRLDHGTVVRADVLDFLAGGRRSDNDAFACCFVDPPYDQPSLVPALELLADPELGWLCPGAVVVAKHFWRDAPGPKIGALAFHRERRFGETMLTFYRLHETPA